MVQTGDNMMALKRGNRAAVLAALHDGGSLSRKRLSMQVHLTPAAITKIVSELIGEGLVREGATMPAPGAGRREVRLALVPGARYALGIMIDRCEAVLSAVRMDGSCVFAETVKIPEGAPAEETVSSLCTGLMELARELPRERLVGVGVAVRGVTDASGRHSVNSMGALSPGTHPIVDWVEAATGLKCYMFNNVRALLAAQLFLAREPEVRGQYFLRCEYGIGAAVAAHGNIWLGGSNRCSELGHIPVVRGGKLCSCGKRGCLETVASPMALSTDAAEILSQENTPLLWRLVGGRHVDAVPLEHILTAAAHGDTAVASLTARAVDYLSQAVRSVIYILDPEKIVLYGHMFNNEYILSRLLAQIHEGVDADRTVRVEKSPYNGMLEPIAAPLLAMENYFETGGMIP